METGFSPHIGSLWRTFLLASIVLLLLLPLAPVSAQGSQPVVCVTAYRLNVRSGPGLSYPVISGLSLDQCVALAGYRSGDATWVQILIPGGGIGWISAYYIRTTYPLISLPVGPGAPTPPPAISEWRGEYFANRDLAGVPVAVRNDGAINFNWGLGAPASGLPADNFSVRWTRSAQFDGATYRFHAVMDDGMRMWVDGQLIINAWLDGAAREIVVDYPFAAGVHSLKVEYYEHGGYAEARVWWDRLSSPPSPTYPNWKGEYYGNRDLAGAPVVVRNDANINFNWGPGAPASGLPADNFSVRWTRSVLFAGANYRFHAVVDDGLRLWVDDQRILDTWMDGGVREVWRDYALGQGTHTIRVEYYERGGSAVAQVWWEQSPSPNSSNYPDWKGEYYANRKLEGSPKLIRNDKKLEFNWKDGRPASELPKDDFSVRWTRTTKFDGATYRFRAKVDDGVRVWVDGQRIINAWEDGPAREIAGDITLAKGNHTITVEYYEHKSDAQIRVWWDEITPIFTEWKGEYYANRNLEGSPRLVRNDREIDFNWKDGSPAAGLPADDFSVRWTREVVFEPGTYRFKIKADDGIRVYIDDKRVLRQWHESEWNRTYQVERELAGKHTLRVEYYEHTGAARVEFSWKRH